MILHEQSGKQNTDATLKAALAYGVKHSIQTMVVASTVGETGLKAALMVKEHGIRLIVVTHNTGFHKIGEQQLTPQNRETIASHGAQIYTGTLVLRGLGAQIRKKAGGSEEELVATTLRMFGQGMKVCVEMAAMVSDGGLVGDGDIICVAGTAEGADTAALIKPAPSNKFFDIKIRDIIAKPWDF